MRLLLDANSAGLELQMSQVRLAKNIEELGRAAAPVSRTQRARSASGPIALGPTAHWFLDWAGHPTPHWNVVTAATSRGPLDAAILAEAALAASSGHDAFRFGLDRDGAAWRSYLRDEPRLAVDRIELAGLPVEQHRDALRTAADAVHAAVGITGGPPARLLHVDRGAGRGAVVMVCANHLISDAYSQAVILQDVEIAYEQLAAGEPLALPRPTATMREWTDALVRLAGWPEVEAERDHWLRTLGDGVPTVPLDFPTGRNTSEAVVSCDVGLSRERTRLLFPASDRPGRRRTLVVLLTAIAVAWARWTGRSELAFGLLSHGRDAAAHGLDLRRTVACTTYAIPVRVALPARGDPGEVAVAVRGALAAAPRVGIGYTLLRHLRGDERLTGIPEPEISINYRGRLAPAGHSLLSQRLAPLSGVRLDPGPARSMILEVDMVVENGELRTRWLYCRNLHRPESISAVAADYLATLNDLLDEGI